MIIALVPKLGSMSLRVERSNPLVHLKKMRLLRRFHSSQ